jgi:hypothetical protein
MTETMNELNAQIVAQMVREKLQGRHPAGLTIEVVDEKVIKIDNWWQVPVRPSGWPEKTFEYYDTLAEVEEELLEQKHVNILLSPMAPAEETEKQVA